ncbi:hypothetical protein [Bradyrhizobium yuanmingense]|uniref:Uncharacterized protein n=1 Tax=Bradyrhizobium yuanmingense TaxID=108015 RepID=A0ABV4GDS8_9BRAD|nr:hypothetical protein [Bradyrhizobium yuanmingense]
MPAKFGDILQAFEFADISGGMGQCRTFVCRQTGKIYYQFDQDDLQELEDANCLTISKTRPNTCRSRTHETSTLASLS